MKESIKKPVTKIPKLSPESVTMAFIVLASMHENSELLSRFIQSIFTLQDPKNSANELETALRNQILPAAQMTCVLPLAERLLLNENSARAAVSFIYIVIRLIYQKMGSAKLTPSESKDLWKRIWEMARLFPVIEKERKIAEAHNNLRDWQLALQEHARDKWKYFTNKQLRQLDSRVNLLVERIQSMITVGSVAVEEKS